MNKKILFSLLLTIAIFSTFFHIKLVFAMTAEEANCTKGTHFDSDSCAPDDNTGGGGGGGGKGVPFINKVLSNIQKIFFIVAAGVVVILWLVTGVLFVTAQGDPGRLSTARKALYASIAGTLLIIIAGSALALINKSFGIK